MLLAELSKQIQALYRMMALLEAPKKDKRGHHPLQELRLLCYMLVEEMIDMICLLPHAVVFGHVCCSHQP